MPCALLPVPAAGSARYYAGPLSLAIPALLLPGLLTGLVVPGAMPTAQAASCGTTNPALNKTVTASSTTVTGTSAAGAATATTFVWTVAPPPTS
jgi:hypothetical protein